MIRALIGNFPGPAAVGSGGEAGVQCVDLHSDGRVAPWKRVLPVRNASFICANAAGDRAYVISAVADYQPPGAAHGPRPPASGCVSTLAVDAASGALDVLSVCSTHGTGPAHCGLAACGTRLVVSNYVGGNAAVYPLDEEGFPGLPVTVLPHAGGGPHPTRQTAPHPHAAVPSPNGRWLYVMDLGIDRIVGYRLDGVARGVQGCTVAPAAGVVLPPGSGPRHLTFAPDGTHAWADLELSSEVVTLGYDPDTGALTPRQTRSSLAGAPAAADTNHPSEIAVSPDGRFVVVANRGRDCLTSFAVNPGDGTLEPVHDVPVGPTPRHFAFTPDGLQILLAEQGAHRLTSHRLDLATGRITPTGHGWDTPSPRTVCFLPR